MIYKGDTLDTMQVNVLKYMISSECCKMHMMGAGKDRQLTQQCDGYRHHFFKERYLSYYGHQLIEQIKRSCCMQIYP
jgi:hypothetical protein